MKSSSIDMFRTGVLAVCALWGAVLCSCGGGNVDRANDDAQPIVHELEYEMTLGYSDDVPDRENVDGLLGMMMKSLWDLEESESCEDPYWEWSDRVAAYIDSLYVNEGMFHSDDTTRYELAMDAIATYIDISCVGAQAEMNGASYVFAAESQFLMMLEQKRLVSEYPGLDFMKEYVLYNRFEASMREWRNRYDMAMERFYSSKPLEDNGDAEERYNQRAADIGAVRSALSEGTTIDRIGDRPDVSKIRKSFHELVPNQMRPAKFLDEPDAPFYTDTVCMHYLEWVDFRDEIVKGMPTGVAESYRNQTTNHILNTLQSVAARFRDDF